jgi:Ser/Thr protein kinase RdoA (MazF antagonist)
MSPDETATGASRILPGLRASAEDWDSLSRRAQLSRLRRLGCTALAAFDIEDPGMTLLRHEANTTFRVETAGGPYVLRINRPQVHTAETIESEMAWLSALRRETDLDVPEPVRSPDGSFVIVASDAGVPVPHACVLMRWLEGRFSDRRLAPVHLRRLGILEARLHEHADRWIPPPGFLRPRVDTLSDAGKIASVTGSAEAALAGDHPTTEDADRGLQLVEELVSADAAALFGEALEVVWATTRKLADTPGSLGLIHGDLHYENFLFHHGAARAIDFDDCGWGFHLYDLAVTLWELEQRPHYDDLRDALLSAYSQHRLLPDDHAAHLRALFVLRRMQMLMWALESRGHAAFRDVWQAWARDELDAIRADLSAARPAGSRGALAVSIDM